jgi:ribosomal protein L24
MSVAVELNPMSDEQHVIFEHIKSGDNVMVDACAGSGKSTTILSVAKYLSDKSIMKVTYNSMLCKEIRQKADALQFKNLRVHTYHSINVQYYCRDGYTDTSIRRVLRNNMSPICDIPPFDILVIDEAQDMTQLYFRFLIKFCRDHGGHIQILILGDRMQGLYEFKGSDSRFLTCADILWTNFELLKSPIWHKCTLRMSYRITNQMGDFVNQIMLGEERLRTCRDGSHVVYLRRNQRDAAKYFINKIYTLITEGNEPSDFFVLAGSLKSSNSLIRCIENELVEHNIPCYIPSFEDDKIDERVIEGKVVFSTFHSVKGRQRKYVFVIGFDNSYFDFYGCDLCPDECPNTLYVACTRATHGLFLVERDQWTDDRPLKFLKKNHHEIKSTDYVTFNGIPQIKFHDAPYIHKPVITYNVTPTDLIKFIPEHVIDEIVPILDRIFICETPPINTEEDVIEIPSMIKTKSGHYEDISDLNGISIPSVYFDHLFSIDVEYPPTYTEDSLSQIHDAGYSLRQLIHREMENIKPHEHDYLHRLVHTMPTTCNSISEYLYLTNLYGAIKEKLYFKIKQIGRDEYNWLSPKSIQQFFDRMNTVFGDECFDDDTGELNAKIEYTLLRGKADDLQHARIDSVLAQHIPVKNSEGKRVMFRFNARLDLVTQHCVWEIKCTNDLTTDHFIQVVIYAWLWRMTMENVMELLNIREFRLINIKNGQIWRLDASTEDLTNIVVLLLKSKYGRNKVYSDTDFFESTKI